MKLKNKMVTLVGGLLITAGWVFVTAPPVSASGAGYVPGGTPIYKSYWRGSGKLRVTVYNAWLPFDCWKDSPYSPFDRFMKITGNAGWIRTAHIHPEPSLPECR